MEAGCIQLGKLVSLPFKLRNNLNGNYCHIDGNQEPTFYFEPQIMNFRQPICLKTGIWEFRFMYWGKNILFWIGTWAHETTKKEH